MLASRRDVNHFVALTKTVKVDDRLSGRGVTRTRKSVRQTETKREGDRESERDTGGGGGGGGRCERKRRRRGKKETEREG